MENGYKCDHCDYTSSRRYNVDRHMQKKHVAPQNVSISPQNVSISPQNVSIAPQNVSISPQNVINTPIVNNHACVQCSKVFSRVDGLKRHMLVCKGTSNHLECVRCHKVFYTRQSKSRHVKSCKVLNTQVSKTVMTPAFLQKCADTLLAGIRNTYTCIEDFDPKNHDVILTRKKQALSEIYNQNKWIPQDVYEWVSILLLVFSTSMRDAIADKMKTDKVGLRYLLTDITALCPKDILEAETMRLKNKISVT